MKTTNVIKNTLDTYNPQRRKCNQNTGRTERNKQICLDYISGKSMAELAKEYSISYGRVRQVILILTRRIEHWLKRSYRNG